MPPAVSPAEIAAREAAVQLVWALVGGFDAYAYNTRSYMPHGKDYTDSIVGWQNLKLFVQSRPDWALEVVTKALKEMAGSAPQP